MAGFRLNSEIIGKFRKLKKFYDHFVKHFPIISVLGLNPANGMILFTLDFCQAIKQTPLRCILAYLS